MQRLSVSLLICLFCLDALSGPYLPVVDVSNGMVSARAAFGEEVAPKKQFETVSVAPVKKKVVKKVVARTAKRNVDTGGEIARGDILNPHKPSSDLWANYDAPLRMPRMDEIAVITSDDLLPEESLSLSPTLNTPAQDTFVNTRDAMAELDALRNEIAQLNERQRRNEEKIAAVRPVMVRTPVAAETPVKPRSVQVESAPIVKEDITPIATVKQDVAPAVENKSVSVAPRRDANDGINIRREIVPMETKKDVIVRSVAPKTVVARPDEPKYVSVENNSMSKMSPSELKKAFKKAYLSENKHLSTYRIDERYDVASEMTSDIEGFTAQRDLSEMDDVVRPLEIKISFLNNDAGLSRDNYDLLSKTASIAVNNPKRAIQIAIPESVTHTKDGRKLAARRLAIVEQVLRDTGVAEQRIIPVLTQRNDDVFILRVISGDMFETLTQQKRNIFGDRVSKKTYKNMTW